MNSASRIHDIFATFLLQDGTLLEAWKRVFGVSSIFEVYRALELSHKELTKIEKFLVGSNIIEKYKKTLDSFYSVLELDNLHMSTSSYKTMLKEPVALINIMSDLMPQYEYNIDEHLKEIQSMLNELLDTLGDIEDDYYMKFAVLKLQESIKMYEVYGVEEFLQYAEIFKCLDKEGKISKVLEIAIALIKNSPKILGFIGDSK